jgi:hypothetical protein
MKHGDRVSLKINGEQINDVRISKWGNRWFACQNEKYGTTCPELFGYDYSYILGDDDQFAIEHYEIKVLPRPIEEVVYGDMVDDGKGEVFVLSRVDEAVNLSYTKNHNSFNFTCSIADLKEAGYKIVQDIQPEELATIKISKSTLEQLKKEGIKIVE